MGFKLGKEVPPMERELVYLLADLCVKWGFCIPYADHERISKMEYYDALSFARDVLLSEGMLENSSWANRIADRFKERFGTDKIDSSTFVDRLRENKENWN